MVLKQCTDLHEKSVTLHSVLHSQQNNWQKWFSFIAKLLSVFPLFAKISSLFVDIIGVL